VTGRFINRASAVLKVFGVRGVALLKRRLFRVQLAGVGNFKRSCLSNALSCKETKVSKLASPYRKPSTAFCSHLALFFKLFVHSGAMPDMWHRAEARQSLVGM